MPRRGTIWQSAVCPYSPWNLLPCSVASTTPVVTWVRPPLSSFGTDSDRVRDGSIMMHGTRREEEEEEEEFITGRRRMIHGDFTWGRVLGGELGSRVLGGGGGGERR